MHVRRALLTLALLGSVVRADIFRWDDNEFIPGTEGIDPGPGVQLDSRDLGYAWLSELDLTGASFKSSNLANADLYESVLSNANLTGATVAGTRFANDSSGGLTKTQLYSTASYQAKDLRGIQLQGSGLDLTGWDFRDQNLTDAVLSKVCLCHGRGEGALVGADFSGANLTDALFLGANLEGANLSGALITGAVFSNGFLSDGPGLTKEQIYSTTSYQRKDLQGVAFPDDLSGWDFSGQNLTNAYLSGGLNGGKLTGTDFSNAIVKGASFGDSLSREQLYSTASYMDGDLSEIFFCCDVDLSLWDFSGQNLMRGSFQGAIFAGSDLSQVNLVMANLQLADLKNANLSQTNLQAANLATTDLTNVNAAQAVYDQWTIFPQGFDPESHGFVFVESAIGDVDGIPGLTNTDLDLLIERVLEDSGSPSDLRLFDLSRDGRIEQADLSIWVTDLKGTHFGDADLNGEVDFSDFLALANNFGERGDWAQGDFNASGDVEFNDFLVLAQNFGKVGSSVESVPEPSSLFLIAFPLALLFAMRRRLQVRYLT